MNTLALRVPLRAVLFLVAGIVPACTSSSAVSKPDQSSARSGPLAVVSGFAASEAVVFDPARDVYFVSNINGNPGVKDGNGFISRIRSDGVLDSLHFIQGGRNGVTLNAPMGSRIQGDTLWVLDVDMLRGFDARSGAPLTGIDLAPAGAGFLNDLTPGPDGDFYITDTGVRWANGKLDHIAPDRLYRVDRNRRVTIALESPALAMPDGIGWDPTGRRFILAPFGGTAVQEWHPGDAAPTNIAPGPGRFDGVEVEPDRTILVTVWNDSSVSTLEGNRLVKRVVLSMPPADASVDMRRRQVGVVSITTNRFELWRWPAR